MAEALRNQKEDVPYDSKDPLYKFSMGWVIDAFGNKNLIYW